VSPPDLPAAPDLRACGERIEHLLEASSTAGPLARERADELVRLVVELYGAGLERVLGLLHDSGRLDDEALDLLAADDLVAGLLLVHGLHPYGVEERVERALGSVRPYLGSHGGDVELLEVNDDGVVRLALLGSCDGCPSSAVTLTLAVEDAVFAAAPEVVRIDVAEPAPRASEGVIPVEALRARLRAPSRAAESGATWREVPDLDGLSSGEVLALDLGLPVVVCRLGSDLLAYRDSCPRCGSSFSGTALERGLGAPLGSAVLTCPGCRAHYDVRRAGADVDDPGGHLEPLPLLDTDGAVRVAVPEPLTGVPA
jgi:Fe-S cluster biogenesis protein NfuA